MACCPSVTSRCCIKTAKRDIMQTMPHDNIETLVFWSQRSWWNSNTATVNKFCYWDLTYRLEFKTRTLTSGLEIKTKTAHLGLQIMIKSLHSTLLAKTVNDKWKQDAVGDGTLRPGDLDQTTLSDVRLVPPPGKLDETYVPSLIVVYFLYYMKT